MEPIIRERFNDCLEKYIIHCETSDWVNKELFKFRFANWINRKVNLRIQPKQKIYELCMQSLKEPFDNKNERGVQFIIQGARERLSHPISLDDVELFKALSEKDDFSLIGTYNRGMSFPILSSWLGTLLPKKFVSVSTVGFVPVINFLFDANISAKGFDFFNQSQEYFKMIKEELKSSGIKPFFLTEINNYVKEQYPNSEIKKQYDECDWNWVTEDFALYIFREYLKLYVPKVKITKTPIDKSKISTITSDEAVEQDYNPSQDNPEEPYRFEPSEPEFNIDTANIENVDDLLDLIEIDNKYRNAKPEVKEVISKKIERGAFANKFKQIAEYKCMVCDEMGLNPLSFKKSNGEYYVEVHHVIPVSGLLVGSLSTANLITVCANHHRQLHYGDCQIEEIDDIKFVFRIDNQQYIIHKLGSLKFKK